METGREGTDKGCSVWTEAAQVSRWPSVTKTQADVTFFMTSDLLQVSESCGNWKISPWHPQVNPGLDCSVKEMKELSSKAGKRQSRLMSQKTSLAWLTKATQRGRHACKAPRHADPYWAASSIPTL